MSTAPVWVAASGPVGPDVLALASDVLVQMRRLPFSGDVYSALFEALIRLQLGTDRYHRLRLADEARDMFAAYLVTAGRAVVEERISATVDGWVIVQDLAAVCRALVEAAGFWRRELDPWQSGGLDGEDR